jgi:hypothetical protein
MDHPRCEKSFLRDPRPPEKWLVQEALAPFDAIFHNYEFALWCHAPRYQSRGGAAVRSVKETAVAIDSPRRRNVDMRVRVDFAHQAGFPRPVFLGVLAYAQAVDPEILDPELPAYFDGFGENSREGFPRNAFFHLLNVLR